ncbi:hypothetical protein JRQ81_011320 [Phrynocephalus forsythii]|uniref:Uncharacterized protein n=1 Tax=Phrynocephalus forsythii TaxID=171643 RepID=A0A9Q0Y1G4_9SAUR|nr:hypothetical protein JRQ81_011320 [Phrynocephalus forsythii]
MPMFELSCNHPLLSSRSLQSFPVPSMAGSVHMMPDTLDGVGCTKELVPSQGGSIGGVSQTAGVLPSGTERN